MNIQHYNVQHYNDIYYNDYHIINFDYVKDKVIIEAILQIFPYIPTFSLRINRPFTTFRHFKRNDNDIIDLTLNIPAYINIIPVLIPVQLQDLYYNEVPNAIKAICIIAENALYKVCKEMGL